MTRLRGASLPGLATGVVPRTSGHTSLLARCAAVVPLARCHPIAPAAATRLRRGRRPLLRLVVLVTVLAVGGLGIRLLHAVRGRCEKPLSARLFAGGVKSRCQQARGRCQQARGGEAGPGPGSSGHRGPAPPPSGLARTANVAQKCWILPSRGRAGFAITVCILRISLVRLGGQLWDGDLVG